jgi:hypothetical protein
MLRCTVTGTIGMIVPEIDKDIIISTELLSDGRQLLQHKSNFTILLPEDPADRVPLDCPVCRILMRDMTDVVCYQKYQCCSDCAMDWAEPNRAKWFEGWRPDEGSVHKRLTIRSAFPSHRSITAQEE